MRKTFAAHQLSIAGQQHLTPSNPIDSFVVLLSLRFTPNITLTTAFSFFFIVATSLSVQHQVLPILHNFGKLFFSFLVKIFVSRKFHYTLLNFNYTFCVHADIVASESPPAFSLLPR